MNYDFSGMMGHTAWLDFKGLLRSRISRCSLYSEYMAVLVLLPGMVLS